jgi:ankyrin repeat protein
MTVHIVNGSFVAPGTAISVNEIRIVRTGKRVWFWILLFFQIVVGIRFLQTLLGLGNASGESDTRDIAVGMLLGNGIILALLWALQYFFAGKLIIGTSSRNIEITMNMRELERAEKEITDAMAASIPTDTVAPLWQAIDANDASRVRALIRSGADPNAVDKLGVSPLDRAACDGQVAIVDALIHGGANVNAKGASDLTALIVAAQKGHTDVVAMLLRSGADPNIADKSGSAALHYAASNGHAAIASALIKQGANVNLCADAGCTPLHCAAMNGNADIVELLLQSAADVSARAEGRSALDLATEEGHASVLAVLQEAAGSDKRVTRIQGQLTHNQLPTGSPAASAVSVPPLVMPSAPIAPAASPAMAPALSQAVAVCAFCGAADRSTKFCQECGKLFQAKNVCSRCSTQLPPGTKFCPECGSRCV